MPEIPLSYLQTCLTLSQSSPPKPTNFRVGSLLLSLPSHTILSTGYTLELPGNTHAEQSCLFKYASNNGISNPATNLSDAFSPPSPEKIDKELVLYCTMEPCAKRSVGNRTCVEWILETRRQGQGAGIQKVFYGVKEPGIFVGESEGVKKLREAGVEVELVEGLEEEILRVAKAGHTGQEVEEDSVQRNPKKRMMETV